MIPLLAIAAWSGTGKTTLLKRVIAILKQRGIRTGLIKHTHHNMDIDTPGKDSYELRKAGADQVMVYNPQRWALITETPEHNEPDLRFLASRMDPSLTDIILVEGFKHEPVPKIVLWRGGSEQCFSELFDEHVIAVAADSAFSLPVPLLDINNAIMVTDFILNWLEEQQ